MPSESGRIPKRPLDFRPLQMPPAFSTSWEGGEASGAAGLEPVTPLWRVAAPTHASDKVFSIPLLFWRPPAVLSHEEPVIGWGPEWSGREVAGIAGAVERCGLRPDGVEAAA